jgi:hypothetical protein
LTAVLFPSLNREERFIPQLPPRLHLQSLVHCHWSRVPNTTVRCQQLKLSDIRGWSVFVEDPGTYLSLHDFSSPHNNLF